MLRLSYVLIKYFPRYMYIFEYPHMCLHEHCRYEFGYIARRRLVFVLRQRSSALTNSPRDSRRRPNVLRQLTAARGSERAQHDDVH